MARCSTSALLGALEQLSEHAARRNDRSNWVSTFLVAKRMETADYGLTTPGSDRGAVDVFVLLPDHPKGRINPFIRPSSSARWLKVAHSGRSTVWNTGTRQGAQRVLFNGNHFENGLAADAIDVVLENLGQTDEPLPGRDGLAVLLTRNVDWPSEPSPQALHREAAAFVGLSLSDFERLTEPHPLGVPILADDEWSPDSILSSGVGPPPDATSVVPAASATPPGVGESFVPSGQAAPPDVPPSQMVRDMQGRFTEFLGTHGIAIDSPQEVLDLLASTMSSQILLMVGPSGSGKSLMAAALSGFFAAPERRCRIEVSRLLARREELLGYYSHLAEAFIAHDPLLDLLNLVSNDSTGAPCITVEEANLSPIEGYFSPLVHGFSHLKTRSLNFSLHNQPDLVAAQNGVEIPPSLTLEPFPRFFATVNVDAESPAPARKVVSRSCVVLFEAPTFATGLASADSLVKPDVHEALGPARASLGDPGDAYQRYSESGGSVYQQALAMRADLLRQAIGIDVITPRQVLKALLYMAWYVELAGADEDDEKVVSTAADNALLHFILPVLPPFHFAKALEALRGASPLGVLADRIERLSVALEGQYFGPPPDFWGALS